MPQDDASDTLITRTQARDLSSIQDMHIVPGCQTGSHILCTFKQFSAVVYQGTDRGLSVQGQLTLQMNKIGSLTGTLKQTNGPDVTVVGQTNGRAINLIFDLGQGRLLFDVGTLQQDIPCGGAAGGPLVGPRSADSGNGGTPSKPGRGGG